MRCRMRCWDIWRCWWPIRKYVPVESIGIEWRTQEMTFDSQVPPYSVTYPISISPSDATKKDVRIESNNPSIISVDSVESGQVTFTIHSEWEARIRITSLADADISDEYGVTITAPSQQFSPNNGIFVDVDTEWTATGRKRRTKATATWDRFTAKVFALDEESEDYVLLEWIHGWDVSKTYVWATDEEYTRAMFTEEVTDKIAREIETLWDDWQIENRFVKFTDETWSMIEQFYSEPLTPEAVEALQEVLVNNEIVTPESYELMFGCNSREFWSLIGPDGETWDWDTPYTFESWAQVIYNWETLTIGEDVFSFNTVFYSSPTSIDFDGTPMEVNTPYELYNGAYIHIEFYFEPISGNDFDFVDDGEWYYIWSSEFDFNGPSSFVEEWYVVENFDSGAEIGNAIVTITWDGFPYHVEVKVPTWDVNPWNRVRVVRRTEDWFDLWEIAGNIPMIELQGITAPADTSVEVWQQTQLHFGLVPSNADVNLEDFYIDSMEPENLKVTNIELSNWEIIVTVKWVTGGHSVLVLVDQNVGSIRASCYVAVTGQQTHITSVSPNSITVDEGGMVDGSISYEPYDWDTTNFSAQSENTNIATIDLMWATLWNWAFQIWWVSAWSTNVIINDWFNSWTIPVTVIEPSYTFTINVENLPEGADIDWEIMDGETGEQLGEISVSSFPITIDALPSWAIELAWNSHEWDWDISIMSFKKEWADKNYQINITCDGYKPLFETVWFDLEDTWDWSYTWYIDTAELDSNVSMTIGFTPVEEPEE